MKNSDKYRLSPMIKDNIYSGKSYWQYVPLILCDENGPLPLWYFS